MQSRSSLRRYSYLTLTFILISIWTIESALAQSKPWIAPKEYVTLKNPVLNDPQGIKDGKTIYTSYCTPCHGDKGKGDGVAAAALNPKPADHSSQAMLNENDGSLFYKISEGRTPMPQYKVVLAEKQRWEVIMYMRTLCKTAKK